jgi:hypothetical protein
VIEHLASGFRHSTDKLGLANISIPKAKPTHSIWHKIEECLEKHVGEKMREVDTHLPGLVVQESEVQAGRLELKHGGDSSTQAGIWCLNRRKNG